jgi:hypothetical protein
MHTGGCLCGGVRYRIRGALRGVIASPLRAVLQDQRSFHRHDQRASFRQHRATAADGLVWYRSSDTAERGFCGRCGGNVFWKQFGRDDISITAGTLDTPTNLSIETHIFVADKSDYYTLNDDAPKRQQW